MGWPLVHSKYILLHELHPLPCVDCFLMLLYSALLFTRHCTKALEVSLPMSIARVHDSLLKRVLKGEKYLKLYSYHFLINGFAVFVTEEQVRYCHMFPPFLLHHHCFPTLKYDGV